MGLNRSSKMLIFQKIDFHSYYPFFKRNTYPPSHEKAIRLHTPIRREKACLRAFKCLSYLRLNIGVTITQTLLGFVIYSKIVG